MTQVSVANELLLTIPHGFEPSSRIKATLEGSYRSNGASCNFRKVRDDVEDILDAMKWAGLISQGQGAPTMDFSALRPAGSPVSTGGTASGVLSFALMFDSVVSGMRRPGKKNSVGVALLDIEHPEILDRVVDGQLVPGWLSKEADRQFKTVFRAVIISPDRWHLVSKETKDALAEAYNAYRVFICKTREVDDQVLFPNVCFPEDQIAMTGTGAYRIKDLIGHDHNASLYGQLYGVSGGFKQTGVKEVYRLTTKEGYEVALTADHKVLTEKRGWVEAGKLHRGEKIELQATVGQEWQGNGNFAEGYLLGQLLGNGTFSEGRATLMFWGGTADSMVKLSEGMLEGLGYHYNTYKAKDGSGRVSIQSRDLSNLAAKYQIFPGKDDCSGVELHTSSQFYEGFLSGYYDADGTVNYRKPFGVGAIQLTSKRKQHLQMVQRMLLRLGVLSRLREATPARMQLLPDGRGGKKEYACEATSRLDISGKPNMIEWANRVGFLHPIKSDRLKEGLGKMTGKTGSKANLGWATFDLLYYRSTEPVYCASVTDIMRLNINGFTASNCTEVRLPTKGTCVLGAMNLGELKPAELPCAFRKSAGWLAHYYDRVAVPNFRKRPDLFDVDNPQNRQVGLGVLGMANYLGYNGLTYRQAAEEIRRALRGEPGHPAIASLVEGYREAAKVFKDWGFVRAFTVQPTASTAYRLKDLRGYNCAPEIQPPQAVRDSEGRPRYTLKSELKGDTNCILPSAIETRDEVPYEVYRDFSEAYQELLNSTGLAHTLSHCFYGETFTLEDLEHFMGSSLESLYYRLDPTDLSKATQKHQTWDTAGDLEFEDDETPTEPLGSCSIDKGYCEACGM